MKHSLKYQELYSKHCLHAYVNFNFAQHTYTIGVYYNNAWPLSTINTLQLFVIF